MIHGLSHSAEWYSILIDPTFNHSAYEVTPFTYHHQVVDVKSKNVPGHWTSVVKVGPTIIHHKMSDEVYEVAFRVTVHKTNLMKAKIGIVTDGELALINVFVVLSSSDK